MIKRIELSYRDYRQSIRDLRTLKIAFTSSIHSMESVTIPKWQVKLINLASTKEFEGERLLAGEAARKVLSEYIENPKKTMPGTRQIPPPHFFLGTVERKLWHIDIKSAYASVYRQHEAETKFTGTKIFDGWTELEPVYQRLKNYKAARNAVPGLMIASKFAINKGEEVTILSKKSKFYNPNIYNMCNYFMHRLARVALDEGNALYWNTDGGFLYDPAPVIKLANQFRLDYTLDYGKLYLNYWGNYEFIGKNEHLKRGRNNNKAYPYEINNIARF